MIITPGIDNSRPMDCVDGKKHSSRKRKTAGILIEYPTRAVMVVRVITDG
jgi:hypothetical protein